MREDGKIDYVEQPGGNLPVLKAFYADAFGWSFTDYGPDYAAFNEGLDGGFDADPEARKTPMVILYAKDLEAMQAKVRAAAGETEDGPGDHPAGGRRFQFRDPSGNELGVWSEV